MSARGKGRPGVRYQYLHLIDGEPGAFSAPDGHICIGHRIMLVPTLRQVREEQRLTLEWFAANGIREPRLAYVLIAPTPRARGGR